MKTKGREAILRMDLASGSAVTAAVSGGADSVALLHLLKSLQQEMEFSLSACHVNHGLRGEESDRDEQFVRALCADWQIPLTVFREDVAAFCKEQGLSLEEGGRIIRYQRLQQAAGDGLIATAHTRSDDAETFFINLLRGTGLRGLCGIEPMREKILRPILDCTRQEVEAYLEGEGLSYVNDSTNQSEEFTRNRIRLRVIPQLLQMQPAFYENFGRMKAHLRQDEDYLQSQAAALLSSAACGKGLTAQLLRQAHPAVLFRAVKTYLARQKIACDSGTFERVSDLLEQKSGRLQLDGRWMLQLQRGVLQTVENRSAEPMMPVCIDGEHIPENPLASGRLCTVNYEQFKNLQEQDCNILKNAIDCDKICGRIFLRSKIEGDSLRPIRRGVTKPLRKWWNELGIPPQNRGLLPVLADEKGPVWAAGLGVDERVAVDETSTNIQVIKIQEEQP